VTCIYVCVHLACCFFRSRLVIAVVLLIVLLMPHHRQVKHRLLIAYVVRVHGDMTARTLFAVWITRVPRGYEEHNVAQLEGVLSSRSPCSRVDGILESSIGVQTTSQVALVLSFPFTTANTRKHTRAQCHIRKKNTPHTQPTNTLKKQKRTSLDSDVRVIRSSWWWWWCAQFSFLLLPPMLHRVSLALC
jgi:hypothetical protein